ncbi:MAG: hypothetical protein RLO12_13905 [Fulvivirga sp.]
MIIIQEDDIVYKKEYPKSVLFWNYIPYLLGYLLLTYWQIGIDLSFIIWFTIVIAFLYLVNVQFQYKIFTLKSEELIIQYPIRIYKRKLELVNRDIELIEYKPVTNSWASPYLKICMKYGDEYRLSFPKDDLMQIVVKLEAMNFDLQKIPY